MTRLILSLATGFLLLFSCQEKPNFIGFTYPDGKHKALVLSYDDGTIEDIELTNLFDQNNLVGTFNLNSGYLGKTRGWPMQNGDTLYQRYVPKDSLLIIYEKHEIAAHGALHKNFTDISSQEILVEINTDLEVLTQLTNREVISLAYPFGNTNEDISELIAETGILNGRTVADTYAFDLPDNFMIWNPTCHDSKALDYLDEYVQAGNEELSLFYVWGHSWEFGDKKRWENMVEFCSRIGKAKDIWSVGNGELTRYLLALEKVNFVGNQITNPANNLAVWLELSSGPQMLKPGQTIEVKL